MLEIRPITPQYAVAPQIQPADVAAIKAAGYTTIICNRPDDEVEPGELAAEVGAAAKAAGLDFVIIPVTHDTLTPAVVGAHGGAMASASGPVLAYCYSGTRCSIVWSLVQARTMPVDDIIAATTAAGYSLGHLRPLFERYAAL